MRIVQITDAQKAEQQLELLRAAEDTIRLFGGGREGQAILKEMGIKAYNVEKRKVMARLKKAVRVMRRMT